MVADPLNVGGVDDLYALDPGEFVAARDHLAKRLRTDGDGDAAAAVKRLRRPTVVAWALNQVARAQPDEIGALLEAGAALREAQVAALGAGSGGALREAGRRRGQIVSALARAADELAGGSHHDEALATVTAASLDPEVGSLLQRGCLTKELAAPSGFDAAGLPELPEPAPPSAARRRQLDQFRRDAAEAEKRAVAASKEAEHAEEHLAIARARVDAARAALARAVGERDRTGAALAEAERG